MKRFYLPIIDPVVLMAVVLSYCPGPGLYDSVSQGGYFLANEMEGPISKSFGLYETGLGDF